MAIGSGTSATSDCCRCNDRGTCQRCSCVKAGRSCVNCLPLRRGHCANANPSSSTDHAGPQSSGTRRSTPASISITNPPRECSVPALSTSSFDSQVSLEDTGSSATNDQCALLSDSITTPLGNHISPLHFIPPFEPVNTSNFSWGMCDGTTFTNLLSSAYDEIVQWRRNLFTLPFGNCGRAFVAEMARLFRAFAERSALESISFLAVNVMCPLLLQRPHGKSKTQDHINCLKRRLPLWKEGKIEELLLRVGPCNNASQNSLIHPPKKRVSLELFQT